MKQRKVIEGSKYTIAYLNGFDAGENGANTTNSHFGNFSTPEKLKDWERGKADGEKRKKEIIEHQNI